MGLLTAYDGLLVRLGIYLLLFWPTVGYYVYADSRKRGMANPVGRGVILGFLGVAGLFAHLATAPRSG
ncbi:MAG: hypothetical protein ABEJ31_03990 [Haloarculaceae archaeon]